MARRSENAGVFTAYGFAKAGGYTGRKEDFEEGLAKSADYATNAQASATAAANSATLANSKAELADSSATTATQSALAAVQSEHDAHQSALAAESYSNKAVGSVDALFIGLFDEQTVTTPYTATGSGAMKAEIEDSGYVVTGTKNKAGLYPFKEGTYNVNGLTIKIEGNSVEVNGTASEGTYFSLRDGTVKTSSEIAGETYSMPAGNWYFSASKKSGYDVGMAILVRKKDNSGSITLTASTPTNYDSSTWGGLCIYVAKNTTINRGSVLCITRESETGAVQEQKSERVQWLQETSYFEVQLGDYIISGGDVTAKKMIVREDSSTKKLCLKYSTRNVPNTYATQVIDIYVPMETGYIDYIFAHTVNGTQSAGGGNVWRLAQIVKVNDSFEQDYFVSALGESEMAIKIQNRDDFIGGTTHGDEWHDSNSFLAILDGDIVDITSKTALTEFTKLEVFSTSTLYDPDDHTTIVGYHGVEWIFTKDGLELLQSVKFAGNYTLVGSYMPMVIAIRDSFSSQSIQITDTYIDDGNFGKYDISESGFTDYPNQLKNDVHVAYMIGEAKDVVFKVEYLDQPKGLTGEGAYVYNGAAYNKLYNAICGYSDTQEVTSDTKWQVRAKIQVTANK